MSLAVTAPSKQRQGERCALCGRRSETGITVPLIGWTGPECKRKVAALEQSLEAHDLTRFLEGPIPFEAEPDEDAHSISRWVFPTDIQAVMQRAEKLGFLFQWGWTEERSGAAQCWLRLPGNSERRRAVWTKLERKQMGATA